MKVAVIGTGYVGLVSGTCFSEIGHDVTCLDINEKKIDMLKRGKSPIYEPGLNELLERNIAAKRLHFTSHYQDIAQARVVFLAVDTPAGEDGKANLNSIRKAAQSVAENMADGSIVVVKSTVPVGTHLRVKEILAQHTEKTFHVVNNPEFLKEGSAIDDFLRPERVVIGVASTEAEEVMQELYAPLVRGGNPILVMSNLSAEMTKYACNCFLATKISFINEIANLCDATGADIDEVRQGMMTDSRIGKKFLYPGVGYGGSCFPKDVQALISTGKQVGSELDIVSAAHETNNRQKTILFEKIKRHFDNQLEGKVFGFWGVSFKPNTDDIREAPALYMAQALLAAKAIVHFYDPIASDNFIEEMNDQSGRLKRFDNKYDCIEGAHAMVLLTEWMEFRHPDFFEIKNRLSEANVFDGRNIYQTKRVLAAGFNYFAIGKHVTVS